MHGDGGRSVGGGVGSRPRGRLIAGPSRRTPFAVASACVELWGCLAYSSNACWLVPPIETRTWRSNAMNPLNNHRHTLILGIVLAVVLALLIGGAQFNQLGLARWFHIVAGVFWIGLLYYFNVAQTPALADVAADKGGPGGAGITKYIAPRALFWFRWGAVATWLGGAWLLGRAGKFVGAFTLGAGLDDPSHYFLTIGTGAWVGTIILFNVWVLIWPNQKKILGMVT